MTSTKKYIMTIMHKIRTTFQIKGAKAKHIIAFLPCAKIAEISHIINASPNNRGEAIGDMIAHFNLERFKESLNLLENTSLKSIK